MERILIVIVISENVSWTHIEPVLRLCHCGSCSREQKISKDDEAENDGEVRDEEGALLQKG